MLIAVPIVFSRSVNNASQSTSQYLKCRALNHFRIKNKRNKFFIILDLNCVNVHSNTRHSQHCKSQNRLAVQVILEIFLTVQLKPTRPLIMLNIERQQFVLQNCQILHSVVRGLHDKNCASQYCFTSDVMYKIMIYKVDLHEPRFVGNIL